MGLKSRIEEALRVLVGLPLWAGGRASNLEWFEFGGRRLVRSKFGKDKGKAREVGDYAPHVQCAWRIVGPKGIIVASSDRFIPAEDLKHDPDNFKWD